MSSDNFHGDKADHVQEIAENMAKVLKRKFPPIEGITRVGRSDLIKLVEKYGTTLTYAVRVITALLTKLERTQQHSMAWKALAKQYRFFMLTVNQTPAFKTLAAENEALKQEMWSCNESHSIDAEFQERNKAHD